VGKAWHREKNSVRDYGVVNCILPLMITSNQIMKQIKGGDLNGRGNSDDSKTQREVEGKNNLSAMAHFS